MMPQVLKNRYHILRPLSSGGFGNTFLAEDSDLPSGRRCVIKQLKPITDDPQGYQLVQERFQREAVILEDLGQGHSQIPALYAYFEEEGLFYLVEEWVEGVTLTEFLQQQGTVSESSVREVLIGILPVLEYMHSKHIIHRDIKPDNIIVRNSDHKPVLIDLGAVKEAMGTIMTVSGNSNHSIVIGTPGFMPSEQSAGRPVYGSDIYSLGMTMIYLLTRKPPQELPSDPSTGEITWRPDAPTVSPTLGNILDRAIQSHPRDRFSTAKEMLDALQTGASSQPTQPPTVPETTVSAPSTQSPTVVAPNTSPPPQTPPKPPLPDWQKAVITGSVVGIFVLGAVVLVRPLIVSSSGESDNTSTPTESTDSTETDTDSSNSPNNTQNQQTASNPNSPTPSPSPSVSPQPSVTPTYNNINGNSNQSESNYNPPAKSLSEQEAVNLIQTWQNYKRRIFAPPYERALGQQVLTGTAYAKNIRRFDGQESSVDWLESNNAYYEYGVQKIDRVERLVSDGNYATLDIVITEQRTLYKDGRMSQEETALDTRLVRYNLQSENGQWKIADYNTLEVLAR